MKYFIIYMIIINVCAFVSMGMDKRAAIRSQRRIRERTLFLLAWAGGSPGVLAGMYLFHHKTRKMKFVIGIPLILMLELAVFLGLHQYTRSRRLSPAGTVASQLHLIADLDPETIEMLLGTSGDTASSTQNQSFPSKGENDHLLAAARAFFKAFDYQIISQDISSGTAVVHAVITNIDTRSLAHDICLDLSARRLSFSKGHASLGDTDYPDLITRHLSETEYDLVDTDVAFHLTLDDESGRWIIPADPALTDALTGNFQQNISDPFILSAQEVFSQYMDSLSGLSAEEWMDYLQIRDIFQTSSASYADRLDHLYMEKISEYFNYRIISASQEGSRASIKVEITSIDMPSVMTLYKEKLLSYASTSESITDGAGALSDSAARYLIESLDQTCQAISSSITIELKNDGTAWQVVISDAFTNALMGDLDAALAVLRN